MNSNKVDFSIVIPVFCNEGSLKKTYDLIKTNVINKNKGRTYEIIFVDDGSYDNSFQELLELRTNDPGKIKLIKLSRNFGQVSAMLAGYQQSVGDCVINISADLQDPPELMNEMLAYFFDQNIPIVIATRKERDESLFRRKTSQFFYSLMQLLSFPEMPRGGFDYALISKKVVKHIVKNYEANPFWQGQILWTGFHKKVLFYERRKREVGTSKWTFSKKLKYLIDGVLGYSYKPLRIMSILGLVVFVLGIVYAIIILIEYFFGNVPFKGWAPIMILILVLSGIQMLMLGILGEYLWRVLDQVRKRPRFIIDSILTSED